MPTDVAVRRAVADDLPAVRRTLARPWRHGYDGVLDADALAEATAAPAVT